MSDDQITDLAWLLPPGRAPRPPADRLQILKEYLMVKYRLAADTGRMAPRRRRTGVHCSRPWAPHRGPSFSVKCGPGNLDNATYPLPQSLPTDPRTLLSLIYTLDQKNGEGQAFGSDGEAFATIGDLIRETIVPPRTAAALYRAAALIPGVTLISRVTNVEGQPGIAIAWTNSTDRNEWIFNPATLQYVGERDYDMSAGKPVVTGNAPSCSAPSSARPGSFHSPRSAVCSFWVSRPGGRAGPRGPVRKVRAPHGRVVDNIDPG